MSCPTCDHTMHLVVAAISVGETSRYWCPRCGTQAARHFGEDELHDIESPKLVERCRALFECYENGKLLGEPWLGFPQVCKTLGIAASINKPEERPQ